MPASRINLEKLALFLEGEDPSNELIKHNLFLTEERAKRLLIRLDWSFSYSNSLSEIFEANPDEFVPGAHSNHYDKLFTEIFTSTYYFNNSVDIIEADRIREVIITHFNSKEGVLKSGFKIDKYGKINVEVFEDSELEDLFKIFEIDFDRQEIRNCITYVSEFIKDNKGQQLPDYLNELEEIIINNRKESDTNFVIKEIKRLLKLYKGTKPD